VEEEEAEGGDRRQRRRLRINPRGAGGLRGLTRGRQRR